MQPPPPPGTPPTPPTPPPYVPPSSTPPPPPPPLVPPPAPPSPPVQTFPESSNPPWGSSRPGAAQPGSMFPPPPPPGNYGWQAPPSPSPQDPKRGRVALGILLAIALLAGVAGLVLSFAGGEGPSGIIVSSRGTNPGVTRIDESLRSDAPDAGVELIGANGNDLDAVVAAAIADIEAFWDVEMPRVFDQDYAPVTGGFYSWSPGEALPACAETADTIEGNAYYCGWEDEIAWDDTTFMPYLLESYGDLAVGVVMAHEWGHAIQARVSYSAQPVTFEQQADCYAGAWVAHTMSGGSEFFEPDAQAMDLALAGFLELGDIPGSSALDEMAHGSAFDRINSFQEGFEDGNQACAEYTDDQIMNRLVQIPFQTLEDSESGGNAPYEDIFEMIDGDLNDYWSYIGPEHYDSAWSDLGAGTPFDPVVPARCGDARVSDSVVFYCTEERAVYYDDSKYMPSVYDSFGDFGVALEYSLEFNIGALSSYDAVPDGEAERLETVECLSGAWTASIFMGDRPTSQMRLSAGDFDEAVQVIIATSAGAEAGTAFDRVSAFRTGVMEGAGACLGS